MSEPSVKVANSNSGDGDVKEMHLRFPYDPASLKRRKLWNKDKLSSPDFFGRGMGGNGKNTQANTLTSHQGDRKENPPDSKHKPGDTQKYNVASESRSHGARSNNGAGFRDNARASLGAKAQYSSQPLSGGGRGLGDANKKYISDRSSVFQSRSHSARDNGGQGVRTTPSGNQMYPSQPSLGGGRRSLAPANNGLKWNSDSRSHAASDQRELRSVKLIRSDNTLNRRSL